MNNNQVRVGIIGLGNIGQQHISHILNYPVKRCEITALCSRTKIQIEGLASAKHFTDYRDMIDSGMCNAVIIASPTMSHLEMGKYALKKGLHVLMEKPLGLSVKEGETLLNVAKPDQVFALMLNQRVAPVFSKMKQIIQSNELGNMQRVHWTMTNWFRPEVYFKVSDWRATWAGEGGGLLLNQCIHNIDILQWLTGMPTSLQGFCGFGRYHDIEVEDEASAFFEYENGASGVFIGSTGESPGMNRFDIVGDNAMLSFDGTSLLLTTNTPATSQFNQQTKDMFGQPNTNTKDITPQHTVNQHALIIANFVDAIIDKKALIAPAKDGLNSLAMANAILLSAWTGKKVSFPLDSKVYQAALDQKLVHSSLREKANIDVNIDMESSYR